MLFEGFGLLLSCVDAMWFDVASVELLNKLSALLSGLFDVFGGVFDFFGQHGSSLFGVQAGGGSGGGGGAGSGVGLGMGTSASEDCRGSSMVSACTALVGAIGAEGSSSSASGGGSANGTTLMMSVLGVLAVVFGSGAFNSFMGDQKYLASLLVLIMQVMEINDFFKGLMLLTTKFTTRVGVLSGFVTHLLGVYSVVFVALKGFALMRGAQQGSMQELMYSAGKYIGIWSLAGGVGSMQELLIGTFHADGSTDRAGLVQYAANGVLHVIAGNNGHGEFALDDTVALQMDGFMRQLRYMLMLLTVSVVFMAELIGGSGVVSGAGNAASATGDPNIAKLLLIMPLVVSVVSFVVSTLVALILCKFSWGILMAFAPLFIFSLAFKPTASLFRSWVNNVLHCIFLQAFVYWVARYFFMKHVVVISLTSIVAMIVHLTNLGPASGFNFAFINAIQMSLIGVASMIVTVFLPRIVGSLTSANTVSGFEQMSGLIGGGIEKAMGQIKGGEKNKNNETISTIEPKNANTGDKQMGANNSNQKSNQNGGAGSNALPSKAHSAEADAKNVGSASQTRASGAPATPKEAAREVPSSGSVNGKRQRSDDR